MKETPTFTDTQQLRGFTSGAPLQENTEGCSSVWKKKKKRYRTMSKTTNRQKRKLTLVQNRGQTLKYNGKVQGGKNISKKRRPQRLQFRDELTAWKEIICDHRNRTEGAAKSGLYTGEWRWDAIGGVGGKDYGIYETYFCISLITTTEKSKTKTHHVTQKEREQTSPKTTKLKQTKRNVREKKQRRQTNTRKQG